MMDILMLWLRIHNERFYDYEKREAKIGNLEETLLFDRAEFTNIRGEICLEFVLATIT